MCGIVGYLGPKPALPVVIEGIKRLEYRGYDSAGVAVVGDGRLDVRKSAGRIHVLEQGLDLDPDVGHLAIAHTRWATHGAPNDVNAHPHLDASGRIALVHNGIIENYQALRTYLKQQGVKLVSDTDTECLVQMIGLRYRGDLEQAVREVLHDIDGTYGIAAICKDEPGVLVAARKGSPLIVGIGKDEFILASDAAAILAHTSHVIYLSDGEMVRISKDGVRTTTLNAVPVTKELEQIEWTLEQIELGGHEHYMAKEIFEQPEALRNCMRGRVDGKAGSVHLGGLAEHWRDLTRAKRIILTGCGTAWHAALVGEYLFEELARIPTETEYASEFRYRNPIIEDGTVVIAISQSGETLDTYAALREARQRGALSLGVVNVVGSTIARETDAGVYLHVGPEIGVASTKAFTGQVTVLAMIAAALGRRKHMSQSSMEQFLSALFEVPEKMQRILEQADLCRDVARRFHERDNWLYLGRGYNYPVALEGALKLKEISYIHAEGLPAAEVKHGPLALIEEGMPVVFIAPNGFQYDKIVSNIMEVKSRGGHVIAIATEGNREVARLVEQVIYVPDIIDPLQPLLTVVPLQLIAYHAAVLRNCNVDKPRNLAKSVTVE
ncbi:MAG: glutamine--fructose-6-phosphate transaminase (isomerizing) [Phycisphaerae bacterium]|nr:MAG: glutamine--fructose-6-phosphate transaminase (isomerizing) [Planctomycetota bacterium]KAB2949751.1 MAG: glutamine--fructose-6-phosphate transaminase (isomerizing) [Phycisphaerae bacterium]MBE7457489.1 glutamine--fructose-6-phosphate transaminase (isomerizing) [Planctomycetia bacterium]MCK6464528.1 glutamine--fructose-6-phosphate transaminase (isomerizing) [Phycisphaerae bacterium]MCL4718865.1 glutamine--fructose-6-phosphate transaminase (isomerizing) [Phycisphaerae bacterium]